MYGTENDFSNSSAIFANQVITLYTQSIGSWSYLIISISGFSIMFGTCIAVLDGYARSAKECFRLTIKRENKIPYYTIIIWAIILGSLIIISLFGSSIKSLVDLATTISFMIAPFVAFANYKLVSTPYVGKENSPQRWLKYLAIGGMIYLIGFSMLFLYARTAL